MKKQKRKKKRIQTKWMKHVMSFWKAHPGKTLGECMKLARPSYSPKK